MNQKSWIRYEQRINIMAPAKVNRRLLDILYTFSESQGEGVTKCYLYILLLGTSPELCVIITLCVWQEPDFKWHACMSKRVWESAWVCIHMGASYSLPYGKRSCQVCSTQKLDMGEDKRVMGDITGSLRAHSVTVELVEGNSKMEGWDWAAHVQERNISMRNAAAVRFFVIYAVNKPTQKTLWLYLHAHSLRLGICVVRWRYSRGTSNWWLMPPTIFVMTHVKHIHIAWRTWIQQPYNWPRTQPARLYQYS